MTKPLCLKYSLIFLRSKQSPFVKTYLEGVPKSEKVIDRIAGADLLSSTGVSFFSTSPRYVDVRREQRLSTLFFHHILYPAGGARAPYQPVVVRGGRALRRCIYPAPNTTHDPTKCTHPLTMPPESSLSSFQQCGQDVSEALWASADPAQHTFFFSPRHPTGTLFHPYHNAKTMQWNAHEETRGLSSSTPPMTPSSFRRPLSHPALLSKALLSRRRSRLLDNCDSTLSLLVGTIESYLNDFQSCSPLPPFSHATVPFGHSSVPSSRLQKDRTKRKEAEKVEQQKKNEKNSERVCSPNYPTEHCAASSSVLERVASLLNDSHAGFLVFGKGKHNSALNQNERTLEGNAAAALLSSTSTQLRKDCDEQTIPVSEDCAKLQAKKVFARVCREYWGIPDGTETSYSESRCKRRVVGYVALQLPDDAVVKIPLPFQKGLEGSRDETMHQKTSAPMACSATSTSTSKKCSVSNNGSENFATLPEVCRLSGGVEPSVPFAVGRHLSSPKKSFPSSFLSSTSGVFTPSPSPSLARALFPHIQFLARITWCDEREPEHVNTDTAWKPENQILEEKKHFSLKGTRDTSVRVWSEDERIEKGEREHKRCTLKKTVESHHPTAFGSLTVTHRTSEFNGISPGVLGTHLDPLIPAKFRTLVEKKHPARRNLRTEEAADSHVGATTSPSSPSLSFAPSLNAEPSLCSSSRVLIGREDAEVYFIPYRPLLLTIFVPSWAEEMCKEQNRARVRKQGGVHQHNDSFPATTSCATGAYPTSPLSRFHFSLRDPTADKVAKNGSVADTFSSTCEKQVWDKMDDDRVSFPSAFSSGRFTWSKKVQLEERVNQLAGCSGDSHPSHCSSKNEGGGCRMETGHLTYEVKAFHGDAIYIPRGWGIEARRVVGSCLIDSSSSSGTTLLSSSLSSSPDELKGSSSSGMNNPRKDVNSSFHLEGRKKVEKKATKGESFSLGRVQVEVDGFFLLYRPYPVLTNEQASLYVSANYVQSNGITDFYDQGGNKVHHHYE